MTTGLGCGTTTGLGFGTGLGSGLGIGLGSGLGFAKKHAGHILSATTSTHYSGKPYEISTSSQPAQISPPELKSQPTPRPWQDQRDGRTHKNMPGIF